MSEQLSRSMKRATFMVTRPGIGRSTYQENEGMVDKRLRRAIEKAMQAFDLEYYGKSVHSRASRRTTSRSS